MSDVCWPVYVLAFPNNDESWNRSVWASRLWWRWWDIIKIRFLVCENYNNVGVRKRNRGKEMIEVTNVMRS